MADLQKIVLEVGEDIFEGAYTELRESSLADSIQAALANRYPYKYEIFEGENELLGGIRERVTVNHMATIFLTDSIAGYLNESGTLVLRGEYVEYGEYEGNIQFLD